MTYSQPYLAYSNPLSGYGQDAWRAQSDAYTLLDLLDAHYAYWQRFTSPDRAGRASLLNQIGYLQTRDDLIRFCERAFHLLLDHHALPKLSTSDAWSLVPSFADLWVECHHGRYQISDVRSGSPAQFAGARPGDQIVSINGLPAEQAVQQFWHGAFDWLTDDARAFAARVLLAGQRNLTRFFTLTRQGCNYDYAVPTLYQQRLQRAPGRVAMETHSIGNRTLGVLRINDGLGDLNTVQAFDTALFQMMHTDGLVIDLRDTGSGGTTDVARGILSRFVAGPTIYQRHIYPTEETRTGIRRSWLEEVSPRGAVYRKPVAVLVGRWTASMGEGLAMGFDAIGARLFGSPMAGLLGGVYTYTLPETGLRVVFPHEELQNIDGTPREHYRPHSCFGYADALSLDGVDEVKTAALTHLANS